MGIDRSHHCCQPRPHQIVYTGSPLLDLLPIFHSSYFASLAAAFYKRMFANDPLVKTFFNPAHQLTGAQPRALADSVLAFSKNLDDLSKIGPAVELIAQKHVALDIKREHYPIVGRNLLAAMVEVLGKETANEEVIKGWTEAYGFLADVLATREEQIYNELQNQPGGWIGKRQFVVTKKVNWRAISFPIILCSDVPPIYRSANPSTSPPSPSNPSTAAKSPPTAPVNTSRFMPTKPRCPRLFPARSLRGITRSRRRLVPASFGSPSNARRAPMGSRTEFSRTGFTMSSKSGTRSTWDRRAATFSWTRRRWRSGLRGLRALGIRNYSSLISSTLLCSLFLGAGIGLTPFVPSTCLFAPSGRPFFSNSCFVFAASVVHVANRIAPDQKIYWFYAASNEDYRPLIEVCLRSTIDADGS